MMAQHETARAKDLVITCIKAEGNLLKFWALVLSSLDTVKLIESRLLEKTNELDLSRGFFRSDDIPVDSICVVKSAIKQKWCRAKVIGHQGFSNVIVQLIDYGNEEIIHVSNVRINNDQILTVPPQALECILADVMPTRGNEWSPEAIKLCEQHLLFNTLSCYVVSKHLNLPVIRVAKKGENQPFVQRLINANLACIKQETAPSPPVSSYKWNYMDVNTTHLVKVSWIEHAHKFYVQLSAVEMELKRVMDTLNSERLPFENLPQLKIPNINSPCLAQLSQTRCYYRGVISAVQQSMCHVFFVDYGFSEIKNVHDLRVLPQEFLVLPAQAIRCSLPEDSNVDVNEFRKRAEISHLQCRVLSRVNDVNIVELLHHNVNIFSPISFTFQKLHVGSTCDVIVSYVNDLTEFYCQLLHFKDQQEAISNILNSGYNFMPIKLPECVPNNPVCAKFSEDQMWYRAKILKVNHEHDIEVFFVDFGNTDHINLDDIKKITPELLRLPVQAFKCYLFETLLPSDSKAKDDAFDYFEKLTTDQPLVANIKAYTEESGYGLILCEKNSTVTINEKLEMSSISIPPTPLNNIDNVYVTSFENANSFFVQFEKLDSNLLSQMQEEINSFYLNSHYKTFMPVEGSVVCAKFADDGQFYRAKVEKIKDGLCSVSFIDYGNKECIPFRDILPMQASFTKYPQFGCVCALDSCPSSVPDDELGELMLERSIQVKKVRCENDKYFVILVENFPENIPIIQFLRKYENKVPRSIHGAGLSGFQEKTVRKENSQRSQIDSQNMKKEANYENRKPYYKEEYPRENIEPSFLAPTKSESFENLTDFSEICIPPKALRNVYVSHVVSPGQFYCQIEEENPKLLKLMKAIEDRYSVDDNKLNFSKFVVDTPCCAEFQEDGVWYRGKIKTINSNSCDIFFVDYGNIDAVPNSKIKKITSELMRPPAQAICCKSFNVSPKGKDWSGDEIDAFIKRTLDKSFGAQFVEKDDNGIYAVNLVDIEKLKEDIFNKEFVNMGYGRLQDAKKTLVLNSHAASSNLSYTTLNVELGFSEAVQVFYGLNPGEIFCQLKSNQKEFQQMMISLQDYYNNLSDSEALIDRPHQGMICVAKFLIDSAWYRAEITKIEMNKISVLYVDYGNIETVDRKNIRFIIQDYTMLPIQAIKCRIRGIKPPGSSWKISNDLGKYFEGDIICKFVSKENDCYLVDMTCNQKNVAQLLISDKIAAFDESVNIAGIQSKDFVETENASQIIIPDRKDSFVVGQLISVTVSYIENPSKFWCQLLDDAEILENLMENIAAQYENTDESSVDSKSLKVGNYCIAQYFEDESWYRARILNYQPDNTYKVFFIDYGNSEIVQLSQVKPILPEFTELPPQCFECSLQNSPRNATTEMITLFRKTVEEAEEIIAKIERIGSNNYIVSLLYDKDEEEVNINQLLFGLNEDSNAVNFDTPKFLSPDIPLGVHEGYISIVNTPEDFYIQLSGSEQELEEMSVELAEICENPETENVDVFCEGYACAAKYSEDENWYRAEITSVQDSTVDVLFVDYGNVDTVEKSSVKQLSEKHLKIAPLSIKCKLNGIIPVSEEWSKESIKTFQDMVLDACLAITFISKDIPASVNIAKDDKEVAQYLVDMELANVDTCAETGEAYAEDHLAPPAEEPISLPSDQVYPRRKLSSNKLVVKICYVDSWEKFFVMPLELSTELDTVMTTLEILYAANKTESDDSKIIDILEDPKTCMPCVAKYSEDDAWYRAIVTDVDGDNIYVTFVDYGNSEVTTLANLRPITPELVKIPPIALECSLYGIQALPGKEQEISAKLEELFVEEVEIEMEICESEPYKVKLNYEGDLAAVFVAEGMAVEKITTPIESDEDYIDNSKLTFADESLEYRVQISKRFFTNVDKIVGNVKFCELENDLIVFHVVSADLENELQDLQQKLQDAYCEAPGNLPNISCMDYCAAKYMEDENWYRAQVLSCDKDKIKVRFIDYGNCETVDRLNIYELISDFTIEPQFSVQCIPFGLKVNKSKEIELQNKLDELIYHESVELKLCKYSHSVSDPCVTDIICGDVDVIEALLNEQFVSHQYVHNNHLNHTFKAKVENIKNDQIFILPLELEEERKTFQSKLQEVCKDGINVECEIKNDYLYAAKVDETWYRVSFDKISNDDVTVHLVDFGNSHKVKITDLILLPYDIHHQPIFVHTCCPSDKIQNLHTGDVVFCEVQKSYSTTSLLDVKIVEVESQNAHIDEESNVHVDEIKGNVNDSEFIEAGENAAETDEVADKIINEDIKTDEVEVTLGAKLENDTSGDNTHRLDTKEYQDDDISSNAIHTSDEEMHNSATNLDGYSESIIEDIKTETENLNENYNRPEIETIVNKSEALDSNKDISEDSKNKFPENESLETAEHMTQKYIVEEIDEDEKNSNDFNIEQNHLAENENLGSTECDMAQESVEEMDRENGKNSNDLNIKHYLENENLETTEDDIAQDEEEIDMESEKNSNDLNIKQNYLEENANLATTECDMAQENIEENDIESEKSSKDLNIEENENLETTEHEMDQKNVCEETDIDEKKINDLNIEHNFEENKSNLDDIESEFVDSLETFQDSNKEFYFESEENSEMVEVKKDPYFESGRDVDSKIVEDMYENSYAENEENNDNSETIQDESEENIYVSSQKVEVNKDPYFESGRDIVSKMVEDIYENSCAENEENDDNSENIQDASKGSDIYENSYLESTENNLTNAQNDNENICLESEERNNNSDIYENIYLQSKDADNTTEIVQHVNKETSFKSDESIDVADSEAVKIIEDSDCQSKESVSINSDVLSNVNENSKLDDCDSDITSIVQSINMDEIQKGFDDNEEEDNFSPKRDDVEMKEHLHFTPENLANAHEMQNADKSKDSELHDTKNDFDTLEAKTCELESETSLLENSEHVTEESGNPIKEARLLNDSVEVDVLDITISGVSDESVFLAVQPESLQHEFSLFKDSMNSKYSSENCSACDETAEFCAVLCENQWYRASILEKDEEKWTLMLIDLGKIITNENNSNIKSLDIEYQNEPPFAIWCALAGVICTSKKDETLVNFLSDLLKEKKPVVKILENFEPYKIDLILDGKSILPILLEKNLIAPKLPKLCVDSGSYKAKYLSLSKNSEKLQVFVCLSMFLDLQSSLNENMQSMYKSENSVSNVEESNLYAVFHDNLWYRGLVLSHSDVTNIFLIDNGETITNCTTFCYLLPEHCLQPAYALPCHTPFINVPNEISDSIKKVFESEFLVEVNTEGNDISVTMTDEHIIEELKALGLKVSDVCESKSVTESHLKEDSNVLPVKLSEEVTVKESSQ